LEQDRQVSLLTETGQADEAVEQRLAVNIEEAVVEIADRQAKALYHLLLPVRADVNRWTTAELVPLFR
jgi:hypothetical protein